MVIKDIGNRNSNWWGSTFSGSFSPPSPAFDFHLHFHFPLPFSVYIVDQVSGGFPRGLFLFPPRFILNDPITSILNKSLAEGTFPDLLPNL